MIPERWKHEIKDDTKAQFHILKKLMHEERVDTVTCATDVG
jgi:DNA topoisomerase-3